ncbi:MAG: transposase [Elusimicrobia bacterium]|nr:transposase [Elusimicrobiota bacterium]
MSRGIDDQEIFLAKDDFQDFLALLKAAKNRFSCKFYAYCLLSTHFHLLAEIEHEPLSTMMKWILGTYSKRFNWRHHRTGHLFGDRFRSLPCRDDSYFLTLLRYIHLNPVRAGLIRLPEEWLWSGHNELLGTAASDIVDADLPLSMLGDSLDAARNQYREFILAGLVDCNAAPDPFEAQGEPPSEVHKREASILRADMVSRRLMELAQAICMAAEVTLDELRGRTKTARLTNARRLLFMRATEDGLPASLLATFLNRNRSSISRLLRSKTTARNATSAMSDTSCCVT